MKNTAIWRKYIVTGVLLVSLTFAFCAGNKADKNETQTAASTENAVTQELDTDLDKYLGLYGTAFSIGKFPENSVVHFDTAGGPYFPINKKFVGKYFIVNDRFSYETTKVASFAGGYIAPRSGSIIVGVEKVTGIIHVQSYYESKKTHGDLVVGDATTDGKFILGPDGKYTLKYSNASIFTWTKK
jgi:hypothetical protein